MTEFATLLAQPGVEEHSTLRGRVGVMAYHGGNLELMTDVIASRVATESDASYYAVIQPPGMRRHLPSTLVDPRESDVLAAFLHHADIVMTIHGFGRRGMFTSLLLGGQNRKFAEHVGVELRITLPAYDIVTDINSIPRPLRGQHPRNPVNVPRHRGVQIELPPRVRGSGPLWREWEGPGLTPHTESLIAGLSRAIKGWPRLREADE